MVSTSFSGAGNRNSAGVPFQCEKPLSGRPPGDRRVQRATEHVRGGVNAAAERERVILPGGNVNCVVDLLGRPFVVVRLVSKNKSKTRFWSSCKSSPVCPHRQHDASPLSAGRDPRQRNSKILLSRGPR